MYFRKFYASNNNTKNMKTLTNYKLLVDADCPMCASTAMLLKTLE